jgi:hypothetical protein
VGLCAVAAALGCNGGGSSGGPGTIGGGSLATLKGFCEQTSAIYATNDLRCIGGKASDYTSTDYCNKVGMATATIQYDASAAKACVDTLQAAAATECAPQPPCLTEVEKGLVPDGQPCTLVEECAIGSQCMRIDDTMCTPLLCTPPSPVGGSCAPGCVPEAICDSNFKCVAATFGDMGAACGDPFTALCKDGLVCALDPASTTGAGTCLPAPAPSAMCTSDYDCNTLFEFCDTTCKPRLAVGASCTDHPTGCQALASCDAVTNRCVSAGHPGEPCGSVFQFCWQASCDDTTNPKAPVCVAYKPLGAACAMGYECTSGVCHDAVCTACP